MRGWERVGGGDRGGRRGEGPGQYLDWERKMTLYENRLQ